MNFINKIKEIKNKAKEAKKSNSIKIASAVIYAFPVGLLLLAAPVYKDMIKNFSFSSDNFIAGVIVFLVLLTCNIILFPISKSLVEDLKDGEIKLTEKEVNDFILSFPEQYHELVINHIAAEAKKNSFVSLFAIKHLKEKLTEEKLKSDLESQSFTNLLLNGEKNELSVKIKEKETQNEF